MCSAVPGEGVGVWGLGFGVRFFVALSPFKAYVVDYVHVHAYPYDIACCLCVLQ